MKRGLGVVAGALLLTGCASPSQPAEPSTSPHLTRHSADPNDPVRRAFETRSPGTDCGSTSRPQGADETLPAKILDCLRHARDTHHVADAAVTAPTTEGHPVTMHYRVLSPSTFAIYVDGSKDTFGPGDWTYSTDRCGSQDRIITQVCAAT